MNFSLQKRTFNGKLVEIPKFIEVLPVIKDKKPVEYVYYALTLTFRAHFTFKDKMKLISKIPKHLYAVIAYEQSIEYHKYDVKHFKAGQDNPCAPHLHLLLKMKDNSNRLLNVTQMINYFTKEFGRTDMMVLHTIEDAQRWKDYIYKHVDKNNKAFPSIRHYTDVQEVSNVLSDGFVAASEDDDY